MKYLIIIFSVLAVNLYSQGLPESFSNLSTVEIKVTPTYSVYVSYDKNVTKIIKRKLHENDLGFGAPFRVISTILDKRDKKEYTIDFQEGLSADPSFTIYENRIDGLVYINSFNGDHLIIPGNGGIYISGHVNSMFNIRRKYELSEGELKEVVQPFYYVGLKTITLKSLELRSETDNKEIIAYIPKNSEIEVLINKVNHYLIKTSFGLIGWAEITDVPINETPIKGLYRAGD